MLINDVTIGDEVAFADWALDVRPRRLRVAEIVRETRPGETRAVRQVKVVELDYSTGAEIPEGATVNVPGAYHLENRSETGNAFLASALTPFARQSGNYERWAAADRTGTEAAERLDSELEAAGLDVERLKASVNPRGFGQVQLVLTAAEAHNLATLVAAGRTAPPAEGGTSGG